MKHYSGLMVPFAHYSYIMYKFSLFFLFLSVEFTSTTGIFVSFTPIVFSGRTTFNACVIKHSFWGINVISSFIRKWNSGSEIVLSFILSVKQPTFWLWMEYSVSLGIISVNKESIKCDSPSLSICHLEKCYNTKWMKSCIVH